MKTYEKPILMVLSLSGNDQLCGNCSEGLTIYDNPTLQGMIIAGRPEIDTNQDNQLSRDEISKCFGTVDTGCTYKIDYYCKFASTGEKVVAWS